MDKGPDKPLRTETERRRRVNRLKKLIILTIILAILLPVLLCIILFLKVGRLEHKVQELEAAREVLLSSQMSDEKRLSAGSGVNGRFAQTGGNAEGVEAGGIGRGTQAAGDEPESGASDHETDLNGIPEEVSETNLQGNTAAIADSSADGTGQERTAESEGETREEDAEELSGEQLYPDYRKVYLTFDDGPSSNTEAILEILDRYGVKATFFVVGKTDEHSQEMYRRIIEAGHTLGMHSYSHRYGEIYASTEAFTEDLEKIRGYLYEMTGQTSCFYRFPGGSSNALSSTDVQELIDVLDERGILYFDWNVVNGDAGSVKLSAAQLADNVTNNMERYRTAIVLMHDAAGKPATVEALPTIIERILQMDQTVILPITEDTARIQQVKAEEVSE